MTIEHHQPKRRARRAAAPLLVSAALLLSGLGGPPTTADTTEPTSAVLVWGTDPDAAERAVRRVGATVGAEVPIVGGVAARMSAAQRALVEAAGLRVTSDTTVEVAAVAGQPTPDADRQLAAVNPGNDWDLDAGAGVGVALVDTGVTEVEDLRGRVVHGPDLSGEGTTRDNFGHGTFMAGLIAGDGEASADLPVRHVGIAPGAHIVSVKVAGADGTTSLSKLLEGIGWVVDNADRHGIRVLNLSVSVPPLSSSHLADPLSAAVETAWASGITVVAASGNDGTLVSSPGRDPWVITVGALDLGTEDGTEDDGVPPWSGRQQERGAFKAKPEVLAPGVSVVSLLAPGSTVARNHPGSVVDGGYLRGSGTSMATAITAGAVAVLTEHHAAATPDDYKGALVNTARPVGGELGGAIDLAAADAATLDAGGAWWQSQPAGFDNAGVASFARMPWAESAGDTPWAGTRWAGTRWAGTRWVEHNWTGTRWAEASPADTRWAGTRWAGTRWAGTRWAGTRWAGDRWDDEVWAGTRWAGTRWAGTRWAGTRWAGTRWAGTRWAGTRWAGTRWAGDVWAGAGFAADSQPTDRP